jgi:mono/diheme cytochrome c family protein
MKYRASGINRLAAGALAFLTVGLLAWCQGGSLIQRASSKARLMNNPLQSDAAAERAGAKLYKRECSACHGERREGSIKVPPLAQPEVYRASPGTLFWILRNGSLTTGMPSFAHLPDAQRWQIIVFLTRLPGSPQQARKPVPSKIHDGGE